LQNIENVGELYIPLFSQCNHLLIYNYNVAQLKTIAIHYKLKVTGTKQQLTESIYTYLYLSQSAVQIQKMLRGHLQRNYNHFRGPAFMNRSKCTNTIDFLTMEELKDIPNEQFFSYKDNDNFMYGFDILSLYNLTCKSIGAIQNPFNKQLISAEVIEKMSSLIRISNVLNKHVCIELPDITKDISATKIIELRALALFQEIDSLGNYSNPSWFMNLNRFQLIQMLKHLIDIWSYRAQLTIEVKKTICPPLGNPFYNVTHVNNYTYLQTTTHIDDVREYILVVLEKFVRSGIDKDNKCLGAYYVLSSLTLVSDDAATSLPWLFQAVTYM
jgi:hypothetical protein